MRGVEPAIWVEIKIDDDISPHAWGWTDRWLDLMDMDLHFPTCVGLNREAYLYSNGT